MTQLTIRKATVDDAEELCRLINEIIEAGGTTALQDPFSPEILADWFISGEFAIVCHVAQAGSGLTGFQFLSRYGDQIAGRHLHRNQCGIHAPLAEEPVHHGRRHDLRHRVAEHGEEARATGDRLHGWSIALVVDEGGYRHGSGPFDKVELVP